MGYLIQRNFKNRFWDMRLSDLEYFDRLEDVKEAEWYDDCIPMIYFDNPEMCQAYVDALNEALKTDEVEVVDSALYDTEQRKDIPAWRNVRQLPFFKCWTLENASFLPKATSLFITGLGPLTKAEVAKIVKPIANEFKKYDYRDAGKYIA